MATAVRVRRDAALLPDWDPIILWYARAIRVMQERPITDPTSWRYQAAIHDYVLGFDPLARPGEALPSPAERDRFWAQCQHGTWFFLPWHRLYLAYFEQIIAGIVAEQGGPDDWALPYWNYSNAANPNARRLPAAFRQPTTPDGDANPLRVTNRNGIANGSGDMATSAQVDLSCLLDPAFTGAFPVPGFGGPATGFSHTGGVIGSLERVPHGAMHNAVGGWMSSFNTAGLDPIFWLHHANIDRLWTVWRERSAGHQDPTQSAWTSDIPFPFHDAAGAEVVHTAGDAIDTTTTPPLGYTYEDLSDPLAPAAEAREATPARIAMSDDQPTPELIGASEEPIRLAGDTVSARVPVSARAGAAGARATPDADIESAPGRVYLAFENITGEDVPEAYEVYLNVPEGEDPTAHPERYAGLLPMFGVPEASAPDDEHGGGGLTYVLEIGAVVRALEAEGAWRGEGDVDVTFVPHQPPAEAEADADTGARVAAREAAPVQIGRVGVYVA